MKLSDSFITLSLLLRLDDVEAHLSGEDEQLVRWLTGESSTRQGVEASIRQCAERWRPASLSGRS